MYQLADSSQFSVIIDYQATERKEWVREESCRYEKTDEWSNGYTPKYGDDENWGKKGIKWEQESVFQI